MPSITFRWASPANYTVAHRPDSAIRLIVIHVTESSAIGAITWFDNPKAQASANYVVAKTGAITEMVPDSDIAWQAGNWVINRESIGIEHEGYTYVPNSFTDAEYRASARLVASEMRHYVLPIDRRHIIGHSQVPDPNHPGLFGGFAHHTDPGPHWDWARYLAYVKTYARGGTPPLTVRRDAPASATNTAKPQQQITAKVSSTGKVTVTSGLANGQTVTGFVRWQATVANGDAKRVDFLVDGRVRWSGTQPPFEFGGAGGGWDTTGETNGLHTLTIRVVAKNGSTAGQSLRVDVANSPFEVAPIGVQNGQTLSGKVRWEAAPSGATPDHVDFLLDGKLVNTEKQAPYVFGGDNGTLDTTALTNGVHALVMRAVAVDGRIAEADLSVVVANVVATPRPRPWPPSGALTHIGLGGVWDGGVFSGLVRWEGQVTGPRPARVEFWIDGRWRWSEAYPPYVFNGDNGRWDTSQETPGTHVLAVLAIGRDGSQLDSKTVTVTVQSPTLKTATPPAPTTMAVVSSISDGSTVHGSLAWTATVSGTTPDHVDFLVDGHLRHTERSAPYEFGTWDTTAEQNGAHVLTVRAVARDGTTATATANVLVANPVIPLAIDTQTVADGQTVTGTIAWSVTTSGPTPDRVEFWVDGTRIAADRSAPFSVGWSTATAANGTHTLTAKAFAGTASAQASVTVTVANAAVSPPAIGSQTLADGAVVSGRVRWAVVVSGTTPDRVEFWIDGRLRWTERLAPYDFNGDGGTWDTTRESDGLHELVVRAVAAGVTTTATIHVTVANAAPAPTPAPVPAPPPAATLAIASDSIADGATLTGTITWSVGVTGAARRVDFLIDGQRAGSLRSAPYAGTLDTTRLSNGPHTFGVRVVGADGTVVSVSHQVTVSNP